jgi:hypothetical protein
VNDYERGKCEERRRIVSRIREVAGVVNQGDLAGTARAINLVAAVIEAEGDSKTIAEAVSRIQEWIT